MNPHYNNHWIHQNHDPHAPAEPARRHITDLIDLYKREKQAQAIRQQAFIACKAIMGGETNL